MGKLIEGIVIFIITCGIPWYLNEKKESQKRREMYSGLQKKHDAEVEKWKK